MGWPDLRPEYTCAMVNRQWIWWVMEVVKTVFSGHTMGVGRSWYLEVSLTQTKPMPSV